METQSSQERPEEFLSVVAGLKELPSEDQRKAAYTFVRDIAYGNIGSRDPFDVLSAHKGTCSGKHALLKLMLEDLGYEVQSWFATHNFGKFPITQWPSELSNFQGKDIPDYHDFLKVNVDGQWITIDAVFDSQLEQFGFPMLEWDGHSNMELPVETSDIFPAEGDMEEHKKRLISSLPAEKQQERKEFLSSLTSWLDSKRESA